MYCEHVSLKYALFLEHLRRCNLLFVVPGSRHIFSPLQHVELPTRHTFRIPSCKSLAKFAHVICWQLSYHCILSSAVQYIYIMQWGFIIPIASCNFNICDLYPSQNCCMFNTVVFWSLVWEYHCFGGTCCLQLSSTLNMKAVCFSEVLVSVCHTTWYSIPEECSHNIHCYKNIKSSKLFYTYSPTTHISDIRFQYGRKLVTQCIYEQNNTEV